MKKETEATIFKSYRIYASQANKLAHLTSGNFAYLDHIKETCQRLLKAQPPIPHMKKTDVSYTALACDPLSHRTCHIVIYTQLFTFFYLTVKLADYSVAKCGQ